MKDLEDELRAAFTAAADNIHPQQVPFNDLADPSKQSHQNIVALQPRRNRWLLPAAAAAAATLVVAGAAVVAINASSARSAAQVRTSGASSTVAGVSFPVPQGWEVETVAHDSDTVTVCVAQAPTADCAGVLLNIVIPNPFTGSFNRVSDPLITGCRWGQLEGSQILANRAAQVSTISCSPTGPRSVAWYLTDGSLSITAPADVAEQAKTIAAGLDLSHWANQGGQQIVESTTGS